MKPPFNAGDRVRFFSLERMDEIRGRVVKVEAACITIQWDDEDIRRCYHAPIELAGRGSVSLCNEEEKEE